MNAWSLFVIGALLVAVLTIALIVFGVRRSLPASGPGDGMPLKRGETMVVSLVGAGALLGIPAALYGMVATGGFLASETSVRVEGLAMSGEYPAVLAASDAPVDAGYESAWVDVANLPGNIRFLLWVEGALPLLTGLVISVAVAWLAMALLRGSPFTRAFPAVLGLVSVVVVGAGIGAQIVGSVARGETVAFLGPPEFLTGPGGFLIYSSVVDLGPVGWGLGIALVAAAFSIGTRLQRDTRGLV